MARSRQSQTGALVPYARGTLRLQHVTFFNWCEPPMGASLSVSMGLISPERRNLFSSDPGVAPRPCAVPSGRRVPLGPIPVPCGVLPAAPLAVVVLGACPPGPAGPGSGLSRGPAGTATLPRALCQHQVRDDICDGLDGAPLPVLWPRGGPAARSGSGGTTAAGCRRWGVPSETIAKSKNPACGVRRCRVRSTSLPS